MALAILERASDNESSWISHAENLPPSPQCEVFAVSLFRFLKLVGRLPLIFFSELFLIGNIVALGEETAHVG